MIHAIISFSLRNKFLVLAFFSVLFAWGLYALSESKIDAIPDLSENQVIVFTEWNGKSARLVEDQITYPLVTHLQGLPMVQNVRGTSMFGMSFIYVIFDDGTDLDQTRQLVLERLNNASNLLPAGVTPSLGPDGTGVGHVLWYTLDMPEMDLGEQRTVQDWYVKPALRNVRGVSEVASFGGFEKQYQIQIDPNKLVFYDLSLQQVLTAVRENNNETSGGKFERSDIGYVIKTNGYLKSIADIEAIALKTSASFPVLIRDVASVQLTGKPRLGVADLNGAGEAVGGIIVMRYGENATDVIGAVKKKMGDITSGLPKGMKFNIVYDRSGLIEESVSSVRRTLGEEMLVISLVVILFLFSWRSAISILVQIPVTIAISFILLNAFGISSNIMSLTGIALAIGVIADNGIIMSENAFRNLSSKRIAPSEPDPLSLNQHDQ